jgi:chitinase
LTDIEASLDLLWRNSITPSKVNLGLAFYGRSFTLSDPDCSAPGCPFSGGGSAGECTQTSGILSDAEIVEIITEYDLDPILDEAGAVKYMTWDSNQWVSYDDAETFQMKINFANAQCLGGTFVWALDLDSSTNQTSLTNLNSNGGTLTTLDLQVKSATTVSNAGTLGLMWTPCLPPGGQFCPTGYTSVASGHGKVFDADLGVLTADGCHGKLRPS